MDVNQRANRMQSLVMQRLRDEAKLTAIAASMGVSTSTVSRLQSDHLEKLCQVIAHAGLKIVDVEHVCVDPDTYQALRHIAVKAMGTPEIADRIMLGNEQ